jgi:hypothetical protein
MLDTRINVVLLVFDVVAHFDGVGHGEHDDGVGHGEHDDGVGHGEHDDGVGQGEHDDGVGQGNLKKGFVSPLLIAKRSVL